MSSPVTRKRARLSESDDAVDMLPKVEEDHTPSDQSATASSAPEAQETIRNEELWFQDGNVILIVGDIGFRVYQGLLAERSPVFKGMFSFLQPPGVPRC